MSRTGEDRLPLIHFTSQDLPAEQNYAVWRQATDTLFDVALPEPEHAGRFQADLTSYSNCRYNVKQYLHKRCIVSTAWNG